MLTLVDSHIVTTVARGNVGREQIALDEGDPVGHLAFARHLARNLDQLRSSSMPTPRAPYFCAARMTMRPSPIRGRTPRRPA